MEGENSMQQEKGWEERLDEVDDGFDELGEKQGSAPARDIFEEVMGVPADYHNEQKLERAANLRDYIRGTGLTMIQFESSYWCNEAAGFWSEWGVFKTGRETEKGLQLKEVIPTTRLESAFTTEHVSVEELQGNELRDNSWVPKSKVRRVTAPSPKLLITAGGESVSEEDVDIAIADTVMTQYGLKYALEGPFASKEDIKKLDWDDHKPSWNGSVWTAEGSLDEVVAHLVEHGWKVGYNDDLKPELG